MAIKVKFRDKKKAIVRFTIEEDSVHFKNLMVKARNELGEHPQVTIEGIDGQEITK